MTIQELQEFHQIINDKFSGKGNFKRIDIENALEKQIPKKIKISEYESFGFFYFCPNCGVNIENRLHKQKYCHNCGQVLDLEDVK